MGSRSGLPHVVPALVVVFLAGPASADSHAKTRPPADAPVLLDDGQSVTYFLFAPGNQVAQMYPSKTSLPPDYQGCYPDLSDTIEHFTTQSLKRDGVQNPVVTAWEYALTMHLSIWVINIFPSNPTTQAYATRHPAFLDWSHAYQAVLGVDACEAQPLQPPSGCTATTCGDVSPCNDKNCQLDGQTCACSYCDTGCWPSDQCPDKETWAQYLPLGMAMVNQKAVNLLNYPPAVSLIGGEDPSDCSNGTYDQSQQDYLANFTMCRWSQVLGASGADDPELYETIVDSRPIAAAGSGLKQDLPDPSTWFDSSTGGTYITPMLTLLTTNSSEGATSTLPVAVLGSPAQQAWPEINDLTEVKITDCNMTQATPSGQYYVDASSGYPCVLQVGSVVLAGNDSPTPYITANHPDVTSYNCCDQDQNKDACYDDEYGWSWDLIEDEQTDFVATCWIQAMSDYPGQDLWLTLQSCKATWVATPQEALCIQATLDNDDPDYKCWSYGDAKAFCQAHDNDACDGIASGNGTKYCGHDTLAEAQAQACPDHTQPSWPSWYQDNCVYEYQNWRLDGACNSR